MRQHREDIFHTTCTACKDLDPRDPSIPLRSSRDDSLCCHVERRAKPAVETSRRCRTFTFTNHIPAQSAESTIHDRSRCSIIPKLEPGTPAANPSGSYHFTFNRFSGGAFHLFKAVCRHAVYMRHAVFETSSTLHTGTPAGNKMCIRIEILAAAERSFFRHDCSDPT